MYYLQSRYYDPEVKRFINADETDSLEKQEDLYDKNLYAYCDNNPVMRVDSGGAVWHLIIGAVVGIATQFIADVGIGLATGNSFGEVICSLSTVDYASAAIGGSGANGKNMRGVYSRSKQVIATTKSARKTAMYAAKIEAVKKNIVKSGVKTFVAGIYSNTHNSFRKNITRSLV